MNYNLTKFIWRIENFDCLKDGTLQSPSFRSHSVCWNLIIYPSPDNKYIHLDLKQLIDETIDRTIGFQSHLSIALLDSNGLPLIWREEKDKTVYKPNKHDAKTICTIVEFKWLVARSDLFGSRKSKFLPNGSLTVECRIWETCYHEILTPRTILARTRFEHLPYTVEKAFILNFKDVSSISCKRIFEHAEPLNIDSLKILVSLSSEQEFLATAVLPKLKINAKFKVSIICAKMNRHEFADFEFNFDEATPEVSFSTNITKLMLMTYKNEFLPNDMLSLEFRCSFLFKTSFSQLIGNSKDSTSDSAVLSHRNVEDDLKKSTPSIKPKAESDAPSDASQTLKYIFEEGFLHGFSLNVGDKSFRVHKAILGARSSVFRAMFTADMKEKDSGSVDIPDVDANTIQRMLKFVYCDSVEEDMQWDSACSLYSAADKYAIHPLKQRCSDILKSELCPSSVLTALLLADTHQDEDMRSAALDFILEHDSQIFGTDHWSKFAEEHSKLTFDAMQKVYLKKMNG